MKVGWKTHAIGRHLVDVPGDAKLLETWKSAGDPLEALQIKSESHFKLIVEQREAELRATPHKKYPSLLIEKVTHAQGAVTLVSWNRPGGEIFYRFDTYFRAGQKAMKYSQDVEPDRKKVILDDSNLLSQEWRELRLGEIPEGIGFVAGDMILADKRFNRESWSLSIQLAGKPDVGFYLSAYTQSKVEPSLRQRAGGIVAGMLGLGLGLVRLRNRERPVGPIWAEEILVAGTQNGKRGYGFKWEAPGKANSLAEPQLNVELEVRESAYTTNAESFKNDEEALELWDAIVDSIRLRPGAV